MTRTNALPKIAETRNSLAWGKRFANGAMGNIHAYVFAAVLIICSVAVGCSSDKPKPVTSDNQIPTSQPQTALATPAPAMPAESKPAPKKIVHKKPATVNYADKTYGVTFEYPRRYAIETGDAATQLLASNPLPMNFVQPGGVALAAVELPETNYANTDFSSAFFNVSVNKAVSADQCGQFAVRQPKSEVKTEVATEVNAEAKSEVKTDSQTEVKPEATSAPASAEVAKQDAPKPDSPTSAQPAPSTEPTNAAKSSAASSDVPANSKLLIGDMELRATEAVSGEGARQSDSKFFHVYQNGACYEFALNVTTDASEDGLVKHVDRDKVFNRLEQILATVKISPAAAPEVTAETPATPVSPAPAQ
ncbi:MAG: hypothetical protein WCF26_01370 [Candidatus Sulfotelmatobacter sp.]